MFTAQNVANTAWASVTANHRDEKLFEALARAAERWLSEFNAQDVPARLGRLQQRTVRMSLRS